MAFSFARIILSDTDIDIYDRGLEYFKKKKVFFKNIGNAGCTAEVQGTQNYEVKLEFHKIVSPKYSCNCPFFQTHSKICKHIIAASIAWDAQRNVPMLEEDLVESACLAPSKITRRDITKAFNNPLEANLEIIRRATDEMGNWSRPHAQLPLRPRVCEKKLENPIQFEKALQEIESWYSRDKYDYYFCAGEMVAGFCEVMRWMKQSWNTFLHEVQMKNGASMPLIKFVQLDWRYFFQQYQERFLHKVHKVQSPVHLNSLKA